MSSRLPWYQSHLCEVCGCASRELTLVANCHNGADCCFRWECDGGCPFSSVITIQRWWRFGRPVRKLNPPEWSYPYECPEIRETAVSTLTPILPREVSAAACDFLPVKHHVYTDGDYECADCESFSNDVREVYNDVPICAGCGQRNCGHGDVSGYLDIESKLVCATQCTFYCPRGHPNTNNEYYDNSFYRQCEQCPRLVYFRRLEPSFDDCIDELRATGLMYYSAYRGHVVVVPAYIHTSPLLREVLEKYWS